MYYQTLKSELAELRLAIREQTDLVIYLNQQDDVWPSTLQATQTRLDNLWDDFTNLNAQLSHQEH